MQLSGVKFSSSLHSYHLYLYLVGTNVNRNHAVITLLPKKPDAADLTLGQKGGGMDYSYRKGGRPLRACSE
jgi:hypothetical protein